MTKALFSRCWSNCPHESRGPGWSCPYIISAGASEEFDRRILRTVRREIGGEAGLIGLRNQSHQRAADRVSAAGHNLIVRKTLASRAIRLARGRIIDLQPRYAGEIARRSSTFTRRTSGV